MRYVENLIIANWTLSEVKIGWRVSNTGLLFLRVTHRRFSFAYNCGC